MRTRRGVLDRLRGWFRVPAAPRQTSAFELGATNTRFKAGDKVRVLSEEEIAATLDEGQMLAGCQFTQEMWGYCGTTQRVLKPLAVFLDERDYRTRKASGIVLLEGLMCQGTAFPQGCDRCCFFLWREEWLEKLE